MKVEVQESVGAVGTRRAATTLTAALVIVAVPFSPVSFRQESLLPSCSTVMQWVWASNHLKNFTQSLLPSSPTSDHDHEQPRGLRRGHQLLPIRVHRGRPAPGWWS